MAKKPASPKPAPEKPAAPEGAAEAQAILDAGHEAAATMPTDAHLLPVRGITVTDEGEARTLEPIPVNREEFDALKTRVDALAALALQNYGKVI